MTSVPFTRTVVVRLRRRLGAVVVALAALTVPYLALAPAASAHDQVVSTSPSDGAVVGPPSSVSVTFSEPVLDVEGANRIIVTGPAGALTGDLTAQGKVVKITFASPLPAGAYTVQWRAASADGHPVSGTFSFRVRGAAVQSSTPVSTATAAASTATPAATTPAATPTAVASPATTPTSNDTAWGPWLIGALVVAALAATALIWSARRRVARDGADGPSSAGSRPAPGEGNEP